MTIEEFKKYCLESISKEQQFEEAQHLVKNLALENYHSGRKQVWLEVYNVLVRWF